jgi:hypothetical protein
MQFIDEKSHHVCINHRVVSIYNENEREGMDKESKKERTEVELV